MTVSAFTGALIAGGRSSRMGRDKAFLDWQGRPLWEVQLAKLSSVGASELLVCGRREQGFEGDGFRFVQDDVEDLGPLAGLANALKEASHETVLVLAVDMPLVTAELLRELLGKCDGLPGRVVVPVVRGRFEPLAAVFPASLSSLAGLRLAGSDRSLQGFCAEALRIGLADGWPVPRDLEALFRSMNAPDDLLPGPR